MKLGLFEANLHNAEIKSEPFETKVAFAKKYGFEGLQHFYSEEVTQEYLERYNAAGLAPACIHVISRITAADDEVFNAAVEEAYKLLGLCKAAGCGHLMIVPCVESDIDGAADRERAALRMAEGLRLIVSEAQSMDIAVSIENFSKSILPFSSPEDIKQMMEWVPGLKYTFDTGNFTCIDVDVVHAYDMLKPYIYMFHVKDFDFTDQELGFFREDGRRFNGCDFGTGRAQLGEILSRASRNFPDAWFVVEYHRARAVCADIGTAGEYVKSFFNK